MNSKNVLAALSGGKDSTVAAQLMIENGYNVTGIYLKLWGGAASDRSCSTADETAAREAAQALNIPIIIRDLTKEFNHKILEPFVARGLVGEITNPCIGCNKEFKIDYLFEVANNLNFGLVVTGHYARIAFENKTHKLSRAKSKKNDQSYFLWRFPPEKLEKFHFPLGTYSAEDTIKFARSRGLAVADKAPSQNLCFSHTDVFDDESPRLDIIVNGKDTGITTSVGSVTVGQRRNLPVQSITGEALYVIGISETAVTIGRKSDLATNYQIIKNSIFHEEPSPMYAIAQLSSQGPPAKCQITDNRNLITYETLQRRVAPGQEIVFYDMDNQYVIGGAIAG